MGGFPALPSGNNSAVSAAGESARAAAGLYNRGETRLQAAARQKATLDRQNKTDAALADQRASEEGHRNLLEQLSIAAAGGINATLPPQGDVPNRPGGRVTLQQDLANPAVPENGTGQTITDARGGKHYMQTPQEQGKAFIPTGGLAGALQSAGWDGKTAITPEHSHSIMQALNAAQPKDEPYDIDTSGKFLDAQGNPAPVAIGRKTGQIKFLSYGGADAQTPAATPAAPSAMAPAPQGGMPGGAFAPPAQAPPAPDQQSNGPFNLDQPAAQTPAAPPVAPGSRAQPGASPAAPPVGPTGGGSVRFALPEKNEPTDQQSVVPGKKGPKGGMVVWNKKTGKTMEVPYPEGTTDELTASQKEADKDRHARMAETANSAADREENRRMRMGIDLTRFNKEFTDRKVKARAELDKAMKDEFATPETKNTALHEYKQEMQQGQTEYETNIRTVQGGKLDHDPWADKLPDKVPDAAAPAKTPAKGAQTAAAPAKGQRTPPPASVSGGLKPGTHTFGNGQTWKKNADGSMVYVSGGK